eukprot:1182826-Prorocentrum_minimum.AAC.2
MNTHEHTYSSHGDAALPPPESLSLSKSACDRNGFCTTVVDTTADGTAGSAGHWPPRLEPPGAPL